MVTVEGPLFRVHHRDFGAVYFGQPGQRDGRFDIDVGVLYLAHEIEGAFLEAVIRDHGLGHAVRLLSHSFLESRRLSEIQMGRSLRVVDISDDGAARLGADARLATGSDYRIAQAWAQALWQHPDRPDGLQYASRHNTRQRCLAVFRRRHPGGDGPEPEDGVTAHALGTFLEPRHVWLLDKYEIGLA